MPYKKFPRIETASPLAVNGNALVIGDKLIVGLNAISIVAISVILEEGEFQASMSNLSFW